MRSDSILEQHGRPFTSFQKKKNVFIYFNFISHTRRQRDDPREWQFVNEA
jgi:hypothetical protein